MFLYLQVLDILTTLIGFRLGNTEASPFVRMVVHWGPFTGGRRLSAAAQAEIDSVDQLLVCSSDRLESLYDAASTQLESGYGARAASLSIAAWTLLGTLAAQSHPNPSLAPGEVIRMVVDTLQNRDSPARNSGIFRIYQFASPANRTLTGPYGNVLRLVKLPPFAPLFSGHADRYGPLAVNWQPSSAKGPLSSGGHGCRMVSFRGVAANSEQTHGRCVGCWMIDGVAPVPHEQSDR